MKVDIVSLFGTFNYGNRLQNYAVQKTLEGMGCEATVIYVQSPKTTFREFAKKVYFSSSVLRLLYKVPDHIVLKYKRQQNFEKFNAEYIKTKRYPSVKQIKDSDYFVLGSDQVWNPKRYDSVKKELFFLTFTKPKKKVCFSPSFGINDIPEKWRVYFSEQLKTFPELSVRERQGAKIIKDLTGRDAEVLIDPTLMLDGDEWREIAKCPKNVDTVTSYILDYFLGGVPENAVKKGDWIANRIGARRYNMFDTSTPGLYTSGPAEFLYLIDHAKLILTDSFHACIFAFLLEKPFILFAREGEDTDMLSRFETLFSTFDLIRKYDGNESENDIFECNYQEGYKILKNERKKILSFLNRNIK